MIRASGLLSNLKKKNYYAILNVTRNIIIRNLARCKEASRSLIIQLGKRVIFLDYIEKPQFFLY